MQPFKLRVDWSCHDAYGDPVVIELEVMGSEAPVVLSEASSIPRAVDYALRWLDGRGFGFWCNVDMHQRLNHTHITLHPQPKKIRESLETDERT